MASGIAPARSGEQLNRDRPSGGTTQGSGWIPVALTLTALAGVTAMSLMRGGEPDRRKANGKRQGSDLRAEPEVERSITIGKPADELYQRWRDPGTLARIMGDFAAVHASGDGHMHWKVEGPLGRTFEWDSEAVGDRPSESTGWRSLPGASIANEGSVRFHEAPTGRGTVVTLRFRLDPPGGALGDAALDLLGTTPLDVIADGVLRRFKSLVETGEIPTTERQPAARADTR